MADLRGFPAGARREAGYQLYLIQHGRLPDDWKSMDAAIGPGTREIRIRDATGAFRILYVAKFEEAIFILHCFLKKTKQTSKSDIELAVKRYRELKEEQAK